MTEREECGDLVLLSFCLSLEGKRQFWVTFPPPTSLLRLLHIQQQLFCAAFILHWCQNPLEARLWLPVIEFLCFVYSCGGPR